MKFKDLPEGAKFRIKRGQGSVLFGIWIKDTRDKDTRDKVMSNAHKPPPNENHRAFVGPSVEVVEE